MSTHIEQAAPRPDGTASGQMSATFARLATAAPPPDHLREMLRAALRQALRPGTADAEYREAMRRACAVARQEGIQPEHLLVALKQAWQELPETRRMLRDTRETTLSSVVTLCIEEYFSPWRARPHHNVPMR